MLNCANGFSRSLSLTLSLLQGAVTVVSFRTGVSRSLAPEKLTHPCLIPARGFVRFSIVM